MTSPLSTGLISSYLLVFSIWMYSSHLRCNTYKMQFLISQLLTLPSLLLPKFLPISIKGTIIYPFPQASLKLDSSLSIITHILSIDQCYKQYLQHSTFNHFPLPLLPSVWLKPPSSCPGLLQYNFFLISILLLCSLSNLSIIQQSEGSY